MMSLLSAQEVNTYLDLQMHPTMHVPYGFFGKGLTSIDSAKAAKISYKHRLKNVNHLEFWKQNSGARIITVGYLTREGIRSTKKAKACILEQLDYVAQKVADIEDSIGFQSDFNGWLNHSRRRYGKAGCYPLSVADRFDPTLYDGISHPSYPVDADYFEAIEKEGMLHPGYLASQWRLLEREGVDLLPIQRNAEHF